MAHDVIVVGAGAIGLAVARELATDHSVLLLERGTPGREASWAAAGMLCPHGEALEDDALFRLGLASLALYRGFVRDLEDETGVDCGYVDAGTLVVAGTDPEWADLERRCEWQRAAGLDTQLLGPRDARVLEPEVTLDIRGALYCGTDHQVNPRLLLESLRASSVKRGVDIRSGVVVDEILERGGRVRGVRAADVSHDAPRVVVAAGAWSGRLAGLAPHVETRPRKGQILALEMPDSRFRHVIRWGQFYLAPRKSRQLIVGATDEEAGFDRRVTVAGLRKLLDASRRIAGCVDAFPLLETWTGLRPQTSDGLPVVGEADLDGLFYAFGHYRNGILLTPVTAGILRDAVRGRVNEHGTAFSPGRFSRSAAPAEPRAAFRSRSSARSGI